MPDFYEFAEKVIFQTIIFRKKIGNFRCSIICEHLLKNNHYAQAFSSTMTQEERFKVMRDFKNFRIRILVSTNVVWFDFVTMFTFYV